MTTAPCFSRGTKRGPPRLRIVVACRDIGRLNEKPIALLALRPVSAAWSFSRLFNLVRAHQSKMQSLALTASVCRATCQARQTSNYLLPLRQARQVRCARVHWRRQGLVERTGFDNSARSRCGAIIGERKNRVRSLYLLFHVSMALAWRRTQRESRVHDRGVVGIAWDG